MRHPLLVTIEFATAPLPALRLSARVQDPTWPHCSTQMRKREAPVLGLLFLAAAIAHPNCAATRASGPRDKNTDDYVIAVDSMSALRPSEPRLDTRQLLA